MLSPEEQAEFLRAIENVRQAAQRHLSANRSLPFAITFVSNLQRGVDHVSRAAADQGPTFDCKAGCSYCCHVRVEVLEPEVFQIVEELKKLPQQEFEALIERLRKHAETAKGVAVLDYRIMCPFLKENLCSIYHVRPAVCRKGHSLDVEKCKTPGAEIPQSLEVVLKSEALIKGTADAYRRVNLSASQHELGQAVLLALTDETVMSRWFNGEKVFNDID